MSTERLLNSKEAAEYIGTDAATLYHLTKDGKIAAIQTGNTTRYEIANLNAYMMAESKSHIEKVRERWEKNKEICRQQGIPLPEKPAILVADDKLKEEENRRKRKQPKNTKALRPGEVWAYSEAQGKYIPYAPKPAPKPTPKPAAATPVTASRFPEPLQRIIDRFSR